jgi:CheY-like chemotaxis protein
VANIVFEGKARRHGFSHDHDPPDDLAVKQGGSKLSDLKRESIPRRVLVVDDNETARISLAILLEVMGHTVATARNGTLALQRVLEFQPEVVLLDLMMPELNGYEVARRIREQSASPRITLIAVTGWSQENGDENHANIFDYYLLKPIDAGALERLLRSDC